MKCHDNHEIVTVPIRLKGQGVVEDFPAIPKYLALCFDLKVYKHELYKDFEHKEEFEEAPLETVKKYCQIEKAGRSLW